MKVNNPLEKRIRKIGSYNNSIIYYSSAQSKTDIIKGRKESNLPWYVVGTTNIKQVIEAIQSYESK